MVRRLTVDEVLALPASTDVPTAGRAFGMSREAAYDAAAQQRFPCPVIRVGRRWVVPRAGILQVLGLNAGDAKSA